MLFLTQSHINDAFVLSNKMSEMRALESAGIRRVQSAINAKNKKAIELILQYGHHIDEMHQYILKIKLVKTEDDEFYFDYHRKHFDLFITKLSFLV
jgi:hypothetical protein